MLETEGGVWELKTALEKVTVLGLEKDGQLAIVSANWLVSLMAMEWGWWRVSGSAQGMEGTSGKVKVGVWARVWATVTGSSLGEQMDSGKAKAKEKGWAVSMGIRYF